jgi:hypothetical protein
MNNPWYGSMSGHGRGGQVEGGSMTHLPKQQQRGVSAVAEKVSYTSGQRRALLLLLVPGLARALSLSLLVPVFAACVAVLTVVAAEARAAKLLLGGGVGADVLRRGHHWGGVLHNAGLQVVPQRVGVLQQLHTRDRRSKGKVTRGDGGELEGGRGRGVDSTVEP